jgi:hypothetical protein
MESPCLLIWCLGAVSWAWHVDSLEFGPWIQNWFQLELNSQLPSGQRSTPIIIGLRKMSI